MVKFNEKLAKNILKKVKKLVELAPNIGNPEYFFNLIDDLDSNENVYPVFLFSEKYIPLIKTLDSEGFLSKIFIANRTPDCTYDELEFDLVLIGKGVTFDTGGYDIKTSRMHEMRSDKAGMCAVLGAVDYIIQEKVPLNILVLLPVIENKIGCLPGSEIKHPVGFTVEIRDTDAEGRLILADAIHEVKRHNLTKRASIVTIATLTGSCEAALGDKTFGVFTNYDTWDQKFDSYLGDKGHLMPTKDAELHINKRMKQLKKLLNYDKKELGGAYGAVFLQKFLPEDTDHIHFDIAGTAYNDDKATGSGLGILIETVLSQLSAYV